MDTINSNPAIQQVNLEWSGKHFGNVPISALCELLKSFKTGGWRMPTTPELLSARDNLVDGFDNAKYYGGSSDPLDMTCRPTSVVDMGTNGSPPDVVQVDARCHLRLVREVREKKGN